MKEVQSFIEELLAHMGVTVENIAVEDDETNVLVQVDVSADDSGMLIGHHGETIKALQQIVDVVFREKSDKRVVINVNDYLERRTQSLEETALRNADRVKDTGEEFVFPYFLSGSERRIVHMTLQEDDEVETFSEGEGRDRRLVIALKEENS